MARNMNVIDCMNMIRDFLLEYDTKDIIIKVDEHDDLKDMLDDAKDLFPYHGVSNIDIDPEDFKYLSKSTTYMDSDLAPKQTFGCLRKSQ